MAMAIMVGGRAGVAMEGVRRGDPSFGLLFFLFPPAVIGRCTMSCSVEVCEHGKT